MMTKVLRTSISVLILASVTLSVFALPFAVPAPVEAAQVDASKNQTRSVDQAVESLATQRCSWTETLFRLKLNCIVLDVVWLVDKFLIVTVLNFSTSLFDWSISYNLTDVTKSAFVGVGWGIVRDITNLFFIFILLWIALATIFDVPGYGAKDLLWQLVAVALLVNFSLAIGGFFINFTNALGRAFYNPIRLNLSDRLLGFTNIHVASTQPLSPTNHQAVCERWADEVRSNRGLPTRLDNSYPGLFNRCINDPAFGERIARENATDPMVDAAIYQALWLILIVPVLSFVFLAAALFFLMRYLQLSILLIFAPIVFLFWILPNTRFLWSDWWNRLIRWSFYAPAFFFLLFLTVTSFQALSNINVGNIPRTVAQTPITPPVGENQPTPDTAAIGGLGTGLTLPGASAAVGGQVFQPKGFFGIGFDMVLFVVLMIMNLMVAQHMGIQGAGLVTGWGERAAKWTGRQVRGAAFRGAMRGAEPAMRAVTESRVGRFMARTPGLRALTQPALAIQERREKLDADRAKQIERAAAVSPDLGLARLRGESMGVQAAFAKSASPDNMRKLMEKMAPEDQEQFVHNLFANKETYRITDLDKKVGEAMAKDARGLTLRVIAKTGRRTSDPNFQNEVNNYLDGLTDRELADAMTPKAIAENHYALNYIAQNFKDERRIGNAVLGTPEKQKEFVDLTRKNLAAAALTDPTLAGRSSVEYFAEVMRKEGNTRGANDLLSIPMLEVLAGAGAQQFTQRRRGRRPPPGGPPGGPPPPPRPGAPPAAPPPPPRIPPPLAPPPAPGVIATPGGPRPTGPAAGPAPTAGTRPRFRFGPEGVTAVPTPPATPGGPPPAETATIDQLTKTIQEEELRIKRVVEPLKQRIDQLNRELGTVATQGRDAEKFRQLTNEIDRLGGVLERSTLRSETRLSGWRRQIDELGGGAAPPSPSLGPSA